MTGVIPSSYSDFYEITSLDFGANLLTGPLNFNFIQMTQLTLFHIAYSYISGTIPESLYGCVYMESLLLNDNLLSGTVSQSVGSLVYLEQLYLNNNNLEGTLPNTINTLPYLVTLYMQFNNFQGRLDSVVNSTSQLYLQDVALSNNLFTGNIPNDAFKLQSLVCAPRLICLCSFLMVSVLEITANSYYTQN